MVVVPGVAQPVWKDGLICVDGSLRPEPPPVNAMWLRRRPSIIFFWQMPVNQDITIASMYSTGVHIVVCVSGTWQLPLSLYLFCVKTVVVAPTTTRVCLVCI